MLRLGLLRTGKLRSAQNALDSRRHFFREQYFQNELDSRIKFDFVLFTLKLKDGMIKIKKKNLNEEVKLKLY
jgi:hypothetical protein